MGKVGILPEVRLKSRLRVVSSSLSAPAGQAVNWAVYDARVRELTDAVRTTLSTEHWAHMMVLALARRSLVACACVVWEPRISKVIPSILTVPVSLTSI